MYKIKFLPARFGDSIWIEYGGPQSTRRLLIDGGTAGTRARIGTEIKALPADQRRLELVVVSHVDRDHIEGVLGLLEDQDPLVEIGDFWFNGFAHLVPESGDEEFGAIQGERLSKAILDLELPWNAAFDGKAVSAPGQGSLPTKTLAGGMQITLLTPSPVELALLKPVWEAEVRAANLDPGFGLQPNDEQEPEGDEQFGAEDLPDIEALSQSPFNGDDSEANGSSISFIAEFEGKRALFAADAHVERLIAALDRFSPGAKPALDLFKISHHGSKRTTSNELIQAVNCSTFVFSTNGSVFKHPHVESVARVIKSGGDAPRLVFNYHGPQNEVWDLDLLKQQHGYSTLYPAAGDEGIEIAL